MPIELQYEVIEENNYSLTVFLNTVDIGYKFSGSELGEILASGEYTIRIEAVDFIGNLGYDEVSFTVTDDISIPITTSRGTSIISRSSSPSTTTTGTKTTSVSIYWHLGFLQVVCCILLTLIVRRKRL